MQKLNLDSIPISTNSDKKASIKLFILFYCFLFLISPITNFNLRNRNLNLINTANAEQSLTKEIIPTPWVGKSTILENKRKRISEFKKKKIEHKIKLKGLNKKIGIITELIEGNQRHHQMLVKNYNSLIWITNENKATLDHEIIVQKLLSSCSKIEQLENFKSELEIKKIFV